MLVKIIILIFNLIFIQDVSKQGISSLLLHFLNLFLAVLISKQNDEDACVWYLVNILLDTSLGVVLEYIFIRLMEVLARKFEIEVLISGCYYSRETNVFDDYSINYSIWTIQTLLWCLISTLMKFVVYLVMLSFPKFLETIGFSMLETISVYPQLELIVVMVFVPLITNVVQFWIVDGFLKETDESRIERLSRGKELLIAVGPEYYEKEMKE